MTTGSPSRPADPAALASAFDPAFVATARPTFEPAGQLELSPPPHGTVTALVAEVERLIDRAGAIATERGVRLELVGTNPFHSGADVPLYRSTPRYLAMQERDAHVRSRFVGVGEAVHQGVGRLSDTLVLTSGRRRARPIGGGSR